MFGVKVIEAVVGSSLAGLGGAYAVWRVNIYQDDTADDMRRKLLALAAVCLPGTEIDYEIPGYCWRYTVPADAKTRKAHGLPKLHNGNTYDNRRHAKAAYPKRSA